MQASADESLRTQQVEQLLSGLINTRSLRLNLQVDKDVRGIDLIRIWINWIIVSKPNVTVTSLKQKRLREIAMSLITIILFLKVVGKTTNWSRFCYAAETTACLVTPPGGATAL